mgnify:CR=1 FL=1
MAAIWVHPTLAVTTIPLPVGAICGAVIGPAGTKIQGGGNDLTDEECAAIDGVTETPFSERAREAAENGLPRLDALDAGDPFGDDDDPDPAPEPAFRTPGGFDPITHYAPPEFGVPVPDDDWTENWFGEGNHRYSHLSPAIDADFRSLLDAPNTVGVHPNQTRGFVPGEPYTGDVNIPGPWGMDEVSSTAIFDRNGRKIGVRNETLPNHQLHPGVVERTILRENGEYFIQTRGGGYGGLGGPNV